MRTLIIVMAVILIISASLGAWYIGRKTHYSVAYKAMVEQTIREMVKQEALRGN